MSALRTTTGKRRELAHRNSDGIEVTLYWDGADGSVAVVVIDHHRNDELEIAVRPDQAMNAFRHPYVYSALDSMRASAALTRAAA